MRRNKFTKHLALLTLTLLIFSQTKISLAHAIDEAVWENQVSEDGSIQASLKLPVGLIDQFDKNGDGQIEDDELNDEMIPIIDKLIWIEGDGARGNLSLRPTSRTDIQATHTSVGAIWTFPSKPKVHVFHYNWFVDSKEDPKCIARFTLEDKSSTAFVFTEKETQYDLSQTSRGIFGFFLIGIEHILLGFDHLLFVAVLMLAGGSAGQLFKMVTAFTVSHSFTLALAVRMPKIFLKT